MTSTEATNAPQEHALSDKKGEVIIANGVFVEIYRVKLKHVLNAQSQDSLSQMCKIMLQVTLFDGKTPTADELMELYIEDFNSIASVITS